MLPINLRNAVRLIVCSATSKSAPLTTSMAMLLSKMAAEQVVILSVVSEAILLAADLMAVVSKAPLVAKAWKIFSICSSVAGVALETATDLNKVTT